MERRTFVTRAILGSASLYLEHAFGQGVEQGRLPGPPPILRHGIPGYQASREGMPGLYPGRVVELQDSRAIKDNHVSQAILHGMLEQGMKELTGESSTVRAWQRFVTPDDVVGIKINPSGAPACCSSPELVREVISGLQSAGVPDPNILVYDRYSSEIQLGGYHALLPAGIRIEGVEHHHFDLAGYDMNVYCDACFFGEWETRSYLVRVVSQTVTKIINIPTMKDHSAAGVTGCLKNLGYGSFSNVARSHHAPVTFTDPLIGMMCSVEPLRSKSVLHIMDGMRQVWHGGPMTQLQSFIAQPGILLVGTDPVAIDTIELDTIMKKRELEGALSLWDRNPANIMREGREYFQNPHKNLFFRQPAHIQQAGELGLGLGDLKKIDRRTIKLG